MNDFIKNKNRVKELPKKDKKKRFRTLFAFALILFWSIGSLLGVIGFIRGFVSGKSAYIAYAETVDTNYTYTSSGFYYNNNPYYFGTSYINSTFSFLPLLNLYSDHFTFSLVEDFSTVYNNTTFYKCRFTYDTGNRNSNLLSTWHFTPYADLVFGDVKIYNFDKSTLIDTVSISDFSSYSFSYSNTGYTLDFLMCSDSVARSNSSTVGFRAVTVPVSLSFVGSLSGDFSYLISSSVDIISTTNIFGGGIVTDFYDCYFTYYSTSGVELFKFILHSCTKSDIENLDPDVVTTFTTVPLWNYNLPTTTRLITGTVADSSSTDYSNGYNQGYSDGYSAGDSSGYSSGYNAGYNQGYNVGYNSGYLAGESSSNQYTFTRLLGAVIDAPVQAFKGLFGFEILGQDMSVFLLSLFSIAIVITVVRALKGG